jgi:hypothetical protein
VAATLIEILQVFRALIALVVPEVSCKSRANVALFVIEVFVLFWANITFVIIVIFLILRAFITRLILPLVLHIVRAVACLSIWLPFFRIGAVVAGIVLVNMVGTQTLTFK